MDGTKTTLERAFELAKSGKCTDIADLRRKLRAEGYSEEQLVGDRLRAQLRAKIKEAADAHRT